MEVSRKNARAVLETLAAQDQKIMQLTALVNALNAGISGLATRLSDVERDLALRRIGAMGAGPTVK